MDCLTVTPFSGQTQNFQAIAVIVLRWPFGGQVTKFLIKHLFDEMSCVAGS